MKATKPPALTVRWSKRDRDIVFDGPSKADQRVVYAAMCRRGNADVREMLDELELRGYDLTTLRFSIRKHAPKEAPTDGLPSPV